MDDVKSMYRLAEAMLPFYAIGSPITTNHSRTHPHTKPQCGLCTVARSKLLFTWRFTSLKMANPQFYLRLMGLALLFTIFTFQGASSDRSTLHKILKRSTGSEGRHPEASVAIPPSRAQEFLAKLSRPKRQVWDRSRPDVQQWIQQFMYMGFDEQRLEADLSYWMDHARSNDQGRQHHYDENSPVGPRDHASYRHGANVNYDYY
ncbi:hypothetical protein WMY93_028612 [Mugilogobius chulae]|uniref:Uncharacterized protein n=1 Tax=Mugilogobius chulae TaxID=88201 RepID=A0AAW0N137_9GOBI